MADQVVLGLGQDAAEIGFGQRLDERLRVGAPRVQFAPVRVREGAAQLADRRAQVLMEVGAQASPSYRSTMGRFMPDLTDRVVSRLRDIGVRAIFGVPGGGGNLDPWQIFRKLHPNLLARGEVSQLTADLGGCVGEKHLAHLLVVVTAWVPKQESLASVL